MYLLLFQEIERNEPVLFSNVSLTQHSAQISQQLVRRWLTWLSCPRVSPVAELAS